MGSFLGKGTLFMKKHIPPKIKGQPTAGHGIRNRKKLLSAMRPGFRFCKVGTVSQMTFETM